MWTIPDVFMCENKFYVSDSSTGPTPRRDHAKIADVVTPAGPWTTFGGVPVGKIIKKRLANLP